MNAVCTSPRLAGDFICWPSQVSTDSHTWVHLTQTLCFSYCSLITLYDNCLTVCLWTIRVARAGSGSGLLLLALSVPGVRLGHGISLSDEQMENWPSSAWPLWGEGSGRNLSPCPHTFSQAGQALLSHPRDPAPQWPFLSLCTLYGHHLTPSASVPGALTVRLMSSPILRVPTTQPVQAESDQGGAHKRSLCLRKPHLSSPCCSGFLEFQCREENKKRSLGICLRLRRGRVNFQLLGPSMLGRGAFRVAASSPKSSSTVNTANHQLIKHISWVYYF